MDLIKQMGGYEKAQEHYDKHHSSPLGHSYLGHQLLQYRREHNIFEVGDYVLRNDGFPSVIKITSVDKGVVECIRHIDGEPRWSSFMLNEIRHATDEEIKAGHRL